MKKCETKEQVCSLPQTECCKTNNSYMIILILFILLAIIVGGIAHF